MPHARALALLAPLALLLAGCAGPPPPPGGSPGPAGALTAHEALARAQGAAQAWQADARLVELYAPEGPAAWAGHAEDLAASPWHGRFPRADDAQPGDGRAPWWMLRYESAAAGRALRVAVGPAGAPATQEDAAEPGARGVQAVVDSPAIAAALEREAAFAGLRACEAAVVLLRLAAEGEGPAAWQVQVWQWDGSMLTWWVDAASGEVAPLATGPSHGPPGEDHGPHRGHRGGTPEERTLEGEVGLATPQAVHVVEVPSASLLLSLAWRGAAAGDRLAVELSDPRGQAVPPAQEFPSEGEPAYAADYHLDAGPGAYRFAVRLVGGGPAGTPSSVKVPYDLALAFTGGTVDPRQGEATGACPAGEPRM